MFKALGIYNTTKICRAFKILRNILRGVLGIFLYLLATCQKIFLIVIQKYTFGLTYFLFVAGLRPVAISCLPRFLLTLLLLRFCFPTFDHFPTLRSPPENQVQQIFLACISPLTICSSLFLFITLPSLCSNSLIQPAALPPLRSLKDFLLCTCPWSLETTKNVVEVEIVRRRRMHKAGKQKNRDRLLFPAPWYRVSLGLIPFHFRHFHVFESILYHTHTNIVSYQSFKVQNIL